MNNFYITGLPRSRTKWFSAFFMSDDIYCHHEGLNGCGSVDDFEERMSLPFSYVGNSDSSLALYPEKLNGPIVIIERDPKDVLHSLEKMFGVSQQLTNSVDEVYERLKEMDGLRVNFDHINRRLEEIWNYCIDLPYPKKKAEIYTSINIQESEFNPCINTYKFLKGM